MKEFRRTLGVVRAIFRARTRRTRGLDVGSGVRFLGKPQITLTPNSTVRIGARTTIVSDSRHTALGVQHEVVLRTLLPNSTIRIGADVGMSGASLCAAHSIEIGDGVLLGANVIVTDTDFHPTISTSRRYAPIPTPRKSDRVVIEENVFVGANAIILKGVRIGRNSVVGAGSIVTSDVPSNTIVAGNPARSVGKVEAIRDDK